MRFLLGMAEAGFFPGMILYLSYWFPARERARAVGFFMSAIAISYAIGAPISGGDHVGLRRRRRAEGLAVAVPHRGDPGARSPASSSWRYLDDGPEHAAWLARATRSAGWPSASRARRRRALQRERHTIGEALKDRRVLVFGLLYFCMVVNVYGLSFWVGEIVDKVGGLSDVGKGFVTAIPYTVAIVGLVLISRHSDRTGERKRHVAIPLAIAAVAFAVSTVVSPVAGDRGARRRPVLPARRAPACSGPCPRRCSAAPPRPRGSRWSTRSATSAASSGPTSSG